MDLRRSDHLTTSRIHQAKYPLSSFAVHGFRDVMPTGLRDRAEDAVLSDKKRGFAAAETEMSNARGAPDRNCDVSRAHRRYRSHLRGGSGKNIL